jgi:hypothetical protein
MIPDAGHGALEVGIARALVAPPSSSSASAASNEAAGGLLHWRPDLNEH